MFITRRGAPAVALIGVALTALTAGCSRGSTATETARQQTASGCAKEGDRCELAPGKIGLCTAKEGTASLTCVSLH